MDALLSRNLDHHRENPEEVLELPAARAATGITDETCAALLHHVPGLDSARPVRASLAFYAFARLVSALGW
jgi:hypothetical protein